MIRWQAEVLELLFWYGERICSPVLQNAERRGTESFLIGMTAKGRSVATVP